MYPALPPALRARPLFLSWHRSSPPPSHYSSHYSSRLPSCHPFHHSSRPPSRPSSAHIISKPTLLPCPLTFSLVLPFSYVSCHSSCPSSAPDTRTTSMSAYFLTPAFIM